MTGTRSPLRDLPTPTTARWQPLRGGLLNLYRFDDEEFWFESGRLLLRGNNGTGKSRVLALQLPFLFDGDVSPHRLEPDGDPAKRIEWNLLMGRHKDRLGYTWIEFGRRLDGVDPAGTGRHHDGDDNGKEILPSGRNGDAVGAGDGNHDNPASDEDDRGADDIPAEYITLGCGLSAAQGRGRVDKWFFSTHRRIGESLSLKTSNSQPFTRARLEEAIGDEGTVYTSAKAYRAAVDAMLFRLGEARYEALVNLLIQLRQPQLSRQLEEKKLSAALSEALPPISDAILADVADAMRGLEAERGDLQAYLQARLATASFLTRYSRYGKIAARRRAADVRSRHTVYDATQRRLKAERHRRENCKSELAASRARLEDLSLAEAENHEAVRTLMESPEMRGAEELDRAREEVGQRETAADRAERDHREAESRSQAAARERDADAQVAKESHAEFKRCAERAVELSAPIGLEREHRAACARSERPDEDAVARISEASARLDEATAGRRRARDVLLALVAEVDEAERALAWSRRRQEELTRNVDEAIEAQRKAETARTASIGALVRDFSEWSSTVRELPLDELLDERATSIEEALREYADGERPRQPIAEIVQGAFERATRRISGLQARHQREIAEVGARLEELRREEAACAAGVHRPPPPPHTRAPEVRAERAGAPLWRLCDFSDALTASERAGLEGALEASGLLDAWVTPEGRVLDAELADTILVAGESARPRGDSHLGTVLVPSIDTADPRVSHVGDATVRAVLQHIGLGRGAGEIHVDVAGDWQLGPLRGFFRKEVAEHIGDAAREETRRARLRELGQAIEEGEEHARAIRDALAELERRHARAVADTERAPRSEVLDRAVAEARARRDEVERERRKLAEAEEEVIRRRRELGESVSKRDETACDLGLESWVADLDGLERAIGAYAQALAALWPSLRAAARALEQAERSTRDATVLEMLAGRSQEELQGALARARAARARLQTLEGAFGASARAVLAQLEAARAELEATRERRRREAERERQLDVDCQVSANNIEKETETLARDEAEREAALFGLRGLVRTRLLEICDVETESGELGNWSPSRGVELARRIEAALCEVRSDDETWARVQRGLYGHVQELTTLLLPQGHDPLLTTEEGLAIVEVPFRGRTCTMDEFHRAVAEEIEQRQTILDAREKEIIENHLIGEVATHLHGRIRAAVELVDEMNRELHARPTSTGMRLRFRWQPLEDGPPGIGEARKRLLAAGGTWSQEDREALGDFLQHQIQSVRSRSDGGTWHENLVEALDYRRWHHFSVERQQDGQWRRLTRRTHGTSSGGEKAIALTVPMFAAAASHYRTADPRAPRLILLDEAFVGVDSDMRSKCMELLHAFDLDFMMTSEREWACYPTLPAVAIYQLSTRPGIDAVGLTRWIWNGRERVRTDAGRGTSGTGARGPEGVYGTAPESAPQRDDSSALRTGPPGNGPAAAQGNTDHEDAGGA